MSSFGKYTLMEYWDFNFQLIGENKVKEVIETNFQMGFFLILDRPIIDNKVMGFQKKTFVIKSSDGNVRT